jgi:hypothetical protein
MSYEKTKTYDLLVFLLTGWHGQSNIEPTFVGNTNVEARNSKQTEKLEGFNNPNGTAKVAAAWNLELW